MERKGIFSTKSLYKFITNRGVVSRVAGIIWKCRMPLKIKFFLWQVFNNKLQVAQSLLKRGWKGDGHCCFCGELETVDHIFFQCHLARLKEIFPGISIPKSLMDFSETWLQGKGPLSLCLIMFIFTCFSWALWTSRNKMAIVKKFPKAPTNIIYVALSFMQKWSILA